MPDLLQELTSKVNFNLFTELTKKKIIGGMSARECFAGELKELPSFADVKFLFNCPGCGQVLKFQKGQSEIECDCDRIINLKSIKGGTRLILPDKIYLQMKRELSQEYSIDGEKVQIIFGEREVNTLSHDGIVRLHISPFFEICGSFKCIDEAHLDHFLMNWNNFPQLLSANGRTLLLKDVLSYRTLDFEAKLGLLKEDELINKIILPLLGKMGYPPPVKRGAHGPGEFGKDILPFAKRNEFGQIEYTAAQAKAVDISAKASGGNVHEIDSQLKTAFAVPYEGQGESIKVDRMMLITSKDISDDARRFLMTNYGNKLVIWNKRSLVDYIRSYWNIYEAKMAIR